MKRRNAPLDQRSEAANIFTENRVPSYALEFVPHVLSKSKAFKPEIIKL